jgi:hypothetical protein
MFNISCHLLSSNRLRLFFGSFRLEVNVKVRGLFHSESNLLTPSCLCLCACRSHLAPCPLQALLAVPLSSLSYCIRHLTPPLSLHAPHHHAPRRCIHHLAVTTATTAEPCDHPLLLCHAATVTQYDCCRHQLPQPPSSHVTATAMPCHAATATQPPLPL